MLLQAYNLIPERITFNDLLPLSPMASQRPSFKKEPIIRRRRPFPRPAASSSADLLSASSFSEGGGGNRSSVVAAPSSLNPPVAIGAEANRGDAGQLKGSASGPSASIVPLLGLKTERASPSPIVPAGGREELRTLMQHAVYAPAINSENPAMAFTSYQMERSDYLGRLREIDFLNQELWRRGFAPLSLSSAETHLGSTPLSTRTWNAAPMQPELLHPPLTPVGSSELTQEDILNLIGLLQEGASSGRDSLSAMDLLQDVIEGDTEPGGRRSSLSMALSLLERYDEQVDDEEESSCIHPMLANHDHHHHDQHEDRAPGPSSVQNSKGEGTDGNATTALLTATLSTVKLEREDEDGDYDEDSSVFTQPSPYPSPSPSPSLLSSEEGGGLAASIEEEKAEGNTSQGSCSTSTTTKKRSRRKKCAIEECVRRARSWGFCKAHSEVTKCSFPGCQRQSQGNRLCIKHGGGKRCEIEGCDKAAQSRGKCKSHGGGVRCQVEGCTRSSQGGGRCRAHGGGPRCSFPGCAKSASRFKLCAQHSDKPDDD